LLGGESQALSLSGQFPLDDSLGDDFYPEPTNALKTILDDSVCKDELASEDMALVNVEPELENRYIYTYHLLHVLSNMQLQRQNKITKSALTALLV